MAEEKKKKRFDIDDYDVVERADEIIEEDKDTQRKEAFKETYKRIAKIIPDYFMAQRKKRKNGTTGGTSFTQNIVVTNENAKVETKEVKVEEKTEKEIGD